MHVGPGRRDASPRRARPSGPERIVGRSTHAPEQGAAADADPDVDYLAVGPVHATPTKPGRPAAGLGYVAWAAAQRDDAVVRDRRARRARTPRAVAAHGARRIVVVRAITEAADPEAAARALRARAGGARWRKRKR